MTHYDVSYEGLEGKAKSDKAIQDIKDYMGEERFKRASEAFKNNGQTSLHIFLLACSFSGVQGYPCKAWYIHLFGEERYQQAKKQYDETEATINIGKEKANESL